MRLTEFSCLNFLSFEWFSVEINGFWCLQLGNSVFRASCVSIGVVWHGKIDEISTMVTFYMFKKKHFLNLERQPTWPVPGLFMGNQLDTWLVKDVIM